MSLTAAAAVSASVSASRTAAQRRELTGRRGAILDPGHRGDPPSQSSLPGRGLTNAVSPHQPPGALVEGQVPRSVPATGRGPGHSTIATAITSQVVIGQPTDRRGRKRHERLVPDQTSPTVPITGTTTQEDVELGPELAASTAEHGDVRHDPDRDRAEDEQEAEHREHVPTPGGAEQESQDQLSTVWR
jgi:hypothetical protein